MLAVLLAGCAIPAAPTASSPAPLGAWSGALPRESTSPSWKGLAVLVAPGPSRIALPGATFPMGSTNADLKLAQALCMREPLHEGICDRDGSYLALLFRLETEAHAVTVSAFSIDRTEVSVAAYDRCVARGACNAPLYEPGDARFDRPDLPVTHVRWQDAAAYCAFAGGRLPTEAEWEYAARGAEGRVFPWGRQWASRRANHGSLASDSTDASDGFVGLAPVESFRDGATPTGILNLAGNASEWVADLVEVQTADPNAPGYPKAPVRNPRGAERGDHVARGGSYRTPSFYLRGAMRGVVIARPHADDIGFRCAYP
jgi:formylglycine-generating enzyme required for sulfatase activity